MSDPRTPPLRRQLVWAIPLLLLLWIKELAFPTDAAAPSLDDSWHAVKGWELLHRPHLGVESVFPYGPLGWFHSACHIPELYVWKLCFWELGLKLALCGLCVLAVVRTRGWCWRLGFALALLWSSATLDSFAYFALVAVFSWSLAEPERDGRAEVPVLLAGTLLCEAKFTFFMMYGIGVPCCAAGMWAASGRGRALRFLARAAGVFAFTWIALGQSLLDLPRYLQTSWWITTGYNDGMSMPGSRGETLLAAGMLATIGFVVVVELWRGPRAPRAWALGALVLLAAWLSYKSGFTRHMANSAVFFSGAPALAWFLLPRPARPERLDRRLAWLKAGALAGLLLGGALGCLLSSNRLEGGPAAFFRMQKEGFVAKLERLAGIGTLRRRLDLHAAALRKRYALPGIAARVGQESVDVFGSAQAFAFLNGLNYHPRPVFQGYSVYTPELLRMNRDFYEGPRAPRYVLYRMERIDHRLPIQEDGLAFLALLTRYHPVLAEQTLVLLERDPVARLAPAAELVLEKDIALDEWVEFAGLPGQALLLELDARRSLLGDLRAFGLSGPLMSCQIERADGSQEEMRLVPRIASEGVLVRPQIENQEQAARTFCGEALPGLKRIRVRVPGGEERLWRSPLHVRILRRDALVPPLREDSLGPVRYPMFDPPPEHVSCAIPFGIQDLAGQPAGLCHAPSTLSWTLEPGHYTLNAGFGLLDDSWKGGYPTDGAEFHVALVPAGERPQSLFQRLLDPRQASGDRGTQVLQLEFDVATSSTLILRTACGPAGDGSRDWAYWTGFRLRRD